MSGQPERVVCDEVGVLQRLGHDLRQPAAAIAMLAAVAELHPDLPAEVGVRLDQIRTEARRISDVCGYLLSEMDGPEPPGRRGARDRRRHRRRHRTSA